MGDGPRGIHIIPDHFSEPAEDLATSTSAADPIPRSNSHGLARKKLKNAAYSLLDMLSLRARTLNEHSEDKVLLSAEELEYLRSELSDLDARVSHCKAQIEQVNELLRSARLTGYLFLRMRWEAFPGEPPAIDDNDVDDWLLRFVVLHGSCIYLYTSATDLSPQDATLLSDIVEVGHLPSLTVKDEETQHCFYISTQYGLRYECSTTSKIQVDSWMAALKQDCKQ